MANPGFDPKDLSEAVELVKRWGTVAEASRQSGIPDATLRRRHHAALRLTANPQQPPEPPSPAEVRDSTFWRRKAAEEQRRASGCARANPRR